MRTHIGVAVDTDELRAFCATSAGVSWHARAPLRNARNVDEAFENVFATLPPALKRARVSVAFSPAWVQTKALHGLPPIKKRQLLNQLLRENQQAFFLWKGTPGLMVDVEIREDGEVWGASFDKEMIDEIADSLKVRRMRLARVVPSRTAIRALIRASPATASEPKRDSLPAPLRHVKTDGEQFLDAYAATAAPRNLPLTWRPQSDAERLRLWSRLGHGVMGLAVAGAAAFAALGPGLRASAFVKKSEQQLTGSRELKFELSRNQAELRRITQALSRVEGFDRERGRITRILGDLSQATPDSTALLTFRVDSAEGSFTVIAPHVADILPELVNVDEISAPRIVGSVTREVVGTAHVERAAFRFRRPRASAVKPQASR